MAGVFRCRVSMQVFFDVEYRCRKCILLLVFLRRPEGRKAYPDGCAYLYGECGAGLSIRMASFLRWEWGWGGWLPVQMSQFDVTPGFFRADGDSAHW